MLVASHAISLRYIVVSPELSRLWTGNPQISEKRPTWFQDAHHWRFPCADPGPNRVSASWTSPLNSQRASWFGHGSKPFKTQVAMYMRLGYHIWFSHPLQPPFNQHVVSKPGLSPLGIESHWNWWFSFQVDHWEISNGKAQQIGRHAGRLGLTEALDGPGWPWMALVAPWEMARSQGTKTCSVTPSMDLELSSGMLDTTWEQSTAWFKIMSTGERNNERKKDMFPPCFPLYTKISGFISPHCHPEPTSAATFSAIPAALQRSMRSERRSRFWSALWPLVHRCTEIPGFLGQDRGLRRCNETRHAKLLR